MEKENLGDVVGLTNDDEGEDVSAEKEEEGCGADETLKDSCEVEGGRQGWRE